MKIWSENDLYDIFYFESLNNLKVRQYEEKRFYDSKIEVKLYKLLLAYNCNN